MGRITDAVSPPAPRPQIPAHRRSTWSASKYLPQRRHGIQRLRMSVANTLRRQYRVTRLVAGAMDSTEFNAKAARAAVEGQGQWPVRDGETLIAVSVNSGMVRSIDAASSASSWRRRSIALVSFMPAMERIW